MSASLEEKRVKKHIQRLREALSAQEKVNAEEALKGFKGQKPQPLRVHLGMINQTALDQEIPVSVIYLDDREETLWVYQKNGKSEGLTPVFLSEVREITYTGLSVQVELLKNLLPPDSYLLDILK